jgi:hypothetical protein
MRAFSVQEKVVIIKFQWQSKGNFDETQHGILIELGAKLNKSENEKRTQKSIQLKRLNAKIARTPKCGIFLKECVAKNCSIWSAGCSENL